jgi:hypothetical protein
MPSRKRKKYVNAVGINAAFETNGVHCVKSFIAPARANKFQLYFWLPIKEKRRLLSENLLPAFNHDHKQQNLGD